MVHHLQHRIAEAIVSLRQDISAPQGYPDH